MRRVNLASLLVAAACAPQNAKLTAGDFTVFLSASNSITVQRERVKLDEFETKHSIDCRDFATARNDKALRLEDRLLICDDDRGVSDDEWPPPHERWLDADGYHVVADQLEPWRGEAIMTSEGDFQLAFHQRLPGNEDFRFVIVIDPQFQPRRCETDASSEDGVSMEELDGDWIANWSDDLAFHDEEGTLYYLNGSSRQYSYTEVAQAESAYIELCAWLFNPTGPQPPAYSPRPWTLPNEWLAGYAAAQFADDRFRIRSARFAPPEAYTEEESDSFGTLGLTERCQAGFPGFQNSRWRVRDLYFCGLIPEDPPEGWPPAAFFLAEEGTDILQCLEDTRLEVEDVAADVLETYQLVGMPAALDDGDTLPSIAPRVHANTWREFDGNDAGLDGWVELHHSWIRFDPGSTIEAGGSASGSFSVLLDAEDTPSRAFVRGNFEVDKIKDDTWTTAFLPDIKFQENETVVCGVPGEDLQ